MAIIAFLDIILGARTEKFDKGLSRSQAALGELKNSIAGAAAAYVSFSAAKSLVSDSISLAAEAEQSAVAFRVLLKDADAADKMLRELKQFAASTPFQFPELRASGQMLLAFGYSASEVTKQLEILGNIAAGTNTPISELAELMGKNRVQGVINTEDLNQLGGRGINVLDGLAKRFGVATTEVKKLASEGKISFADLQAAMEDLSAGDFAGLMVEQSATLNGQFSTLKDTIGEIKTELGTSLLPLLKDLAEESLPLVKNFGAGMESLRNVSATLEATNGRFQWDYEAAHAQALDDIEAQNDFLAKQIAARHSLDALRAELAAGTIDEQYFSKRAAGIKASAPGFIDGNDAPVAPDLSAANAGAELVKQQLPNKQDEADKRAALSRLEHLREEIAVLREGADAAMRMRLAGHLDPKQLAEFDELLRQKREFEDTKAGDSVRALLATPLESLAMQLAEYQRLLDVGAISRETFDRAKGEANTKLQELSERSTTSPPPSFGALQKGSVEAFSAGMRNEKASEQAKLQQEANKIAAQQLEQLVALNQKPQTAVGNVEN